MFIIYSLFSITDTSTGTNPFFYNKQLDKFLSILRRRLYNKFVVENVHTANSTRHQNERHIIILIHIRIVIANHCYSFEQLTHALLVKHCVDMFDTKSKLLCNLSSLFHMLFYISNLSRATQACFRFVSYVVLYSITLKSHTRVFQVCSICCFIFQTYQEPHTRVSGLFHRLFYISNLSRATQTCFRFFSYVVLYSITIKSHTSVFQVCSICCFIFHTYQEPHKRVSGLFHMLFYIP